MSSCPECNTSAAVVLMMVGPIVLLAIALGRFIARSILVSTVKG